MSPASALALFAAMLVLAALPSISVMTVTGRAAALGFGHGAWTAAGIVLGDLFYMILALGGLTLLAAVMNDWLWLLNYLAAAYLIGVGIRMWWRSPSAACAGKSSGGPWWSSALAGLMVTMGDQKAVFFCLAFLPAFVNLDALRWWHVLAVAGITVIAVGGVKLLYAWLAARIGVLAGRRASGVLNKVGGSILVVAGLWLLGRRPGNAL